MKFSIYLYNISTLARHGGWKNNDFLKHGLGDIPTQQKLPLGGEKTSMEERCSKFWAKKLQRREIFMSCGGYVAFTTRLSVFAICQTISNYIKLIRYIFHFSSTLKFSKWDIFILSAETSFLQIIHSTSSNIATLKPVRERNWITPINLRFNILEKLMHPSKLTWIPKMMVWKRVDSL